MRVHLVDYLQFNYPITVKPIHRLMVNKINIFYGKNHYYLQQTPCQNFKNRE